MLGEYNYHSPSTLVKGVWKISAKYIDVIAENLVGPKQKTHITASTVLLNGTWNAELKPNRRRNPKGFVITNRWQDIILDPPIELVEQFVRKHS